MRKKSKKLILVLGIIFSIFGITWSIPSFLQKIYVGLGISAFFVILGVILITIAYGEDE